jgi:hypothetical protein
MINKSIIIFSTTASHGLTLSIPPPREFATLYTPVREASDSENSILIQNK